MALCPSLLKSVRERAGVVGLGIVCLMVGKPNLIASLVIIVVSALLGLAFSTPSWQPRAVAVPAEEIK